MRIFVVGSGKLANELLSSDVIFPGEILHWESKHKLLNERAVIVHAGSGRQLQECFEFCEKTNSILIELSTGLGTENMNPNFVLILCPNTSILLLKVLSLLRLHGSYFKNAEISIVESHQSSKKTAPGTAFSFAHALHFPVSKIKSIRDAATQLNELGIPVEYLDKHAYHKIVIKDGSDVVTIETKVLGHRSYAQGVKKIVDLVLTRHFEKGTYSVLDLIDRNFIE